MGNMENILEKKTINISENSLKDKEIKKKKKLIETEKNRLIQFLSNKNIDNDKLNIAIDLINDIAFMTVESAELKKQVQIYGTTEEYQNGATQRGRKKSACFEAYLNMTKQKAGLIKQLTDLLPVESENAYNPIIKDNETIDNFEKFLKLRESKNESNN